jgi:5-methylcytosine-specific restriction endonuclease McrA
MKYTDGDEFERVVLKTCKGESETRPRVKPIDNFFDNMKVEFPRNLREKYPIGTTFIATVKVCQKHNKDGALRGPKYLKADTKTIDIYEKSKSSTEEMAVQKSGTQSGRAYEYIRRNDVTEDTATKSDFNQLREVAYSKAVYLVESTTSQAKIRERQGLIKKYALLRSKSQCEACEEPAPFLKKNGEAYLEVHHIIELSKGGADSPDNVAAICPNCHARVTHSSDANTYNATIQNKIRKLEDAIDNLI